MAFDPDRTKQVQTNNGETHIDTLSIKMIYQIFIHRFREVPTSQKKYTDVINIDDDEWSGRTRICQYKINVNCLMTNSRLCKMRIISNDKCSFCETHPKEEKKKRKKRKKKRGKGSREGSRKKSGNIIANQSFNLYASH